jgi:hypothetical protein
MCGPFMNGAATIQSGLTFSIYFNQKRDAALSTVNSLLRYLGYGDESHLKQRLHVVILIDRGYHVASVIRVF